MKTYTKETLIEALRVIREKEWIENARHGNDGGVGNTLEDLLGLTENNLPLPNAAEWELKCQRGDTSSLTTLIHLEPSPTAMKLVPSLLLPKYGWKHKQAEKKYPPSEMSFRQTLNAVNRTDRGFGVIVNDKERKIEVSFDARHVDSRHNSWLESVRKRIGLDELSPQPYWGFDDLFHRAASKLHNCFYVKADVKRLDGREHYHYKKILVLQKLSVENFINALRQGALLVDFDARTGHNHGTKFRLRQKMMPMLYESSSEI